MAPRSDWKGSSEAGLTLAEALVILWVAGALFLVTVGGMARALEQSSTRSLSATIRGLVAEAQTRAVTSRANVAIVFEDTPRGATARIYADGDWDGVTREDIQSGADRPLGSAVLLREERAFLGIPAEVTRDPMGNRLSSRDPVRFGRGSKLSFSPNFTATPGSVYLRDFPGKEAWAFRVAGVDGRVRVYRWGRGKWTEVK
jgi:hypothetical protein